MTQLIRNSEPRSTHAPRLAAPSTKSVRGTASDWIVQYLERRGIEVVFGIPGGAILPLYDALARSRLRHVLARHEQGAAFMAQGMARVSGRAAVCFATSGPGATNLVTALADARADSVPLVAITAQVPRALIGSDAFQEVATCQLMRPVTKESLFVASADELPQALERAFEIAEGGRKGPVLVDIPKDVLSGPPPAPAARLGSPGRSLGGAVNLRPSGVGRRASSRGRVGRLLDAASQDTWRHVAQLIAASKRPLLYIGGGIRWSRAEAPLLSLARRADMAVVSSLHGIGAYPPDDPGWLGMIGMHGSACANHATDEADLVLAVGVRFDDRATGKPEAFCRNARIVHLDLDPRELGKIKPVAVGIVADARRGLDALLAAVSPSARPAWRKRLNTLRVRYPDHPRGTACDLLRRVDRALPLGSLVTTDVGQHQMWVAQCLKFSEARSLLTSGGLGTMGFGLPAAIGAALQCPQRPVLCVSGDGSILMNLQELATLSELELNVTVLVLNNAQLGMVRQQQEMFYGRRCVASRFECQPDFARIASGFGLPAQRRLAASMSEPWLRSVLCRPGPQLLEARFAGDDNVLPVVPAGVGNLEMILDA